MRKRAFTLVEIMVVVVIIGILMAIAVPQWQSARQRTRQTTCFFNIKRIEDAKDQLAIMNKLSNGDPVTEVDIYPIFIKSTTLPACPEGGTYDFKVIGTESSCSVHGSPL